MMLHVHLMHERSVVGCIGPFCTSLCGLIKMLEKRKRERGGEREIKGEVISCNVAIVLTIGSRGIFGMRK